MSLLTRTLFVTLSTLAFAYRSGAPVAKAELTRILQYRVLVSRTWPLSHTRSHTALYIDRVHGSRVDETRTQTSRAGLYTKRRPHTHTICFIRCPTSVQRRGPVWFRPSPVAHRLASASPDRSLPESPLPPSPPSSFIVRVEVGRDRHAQKAGSGGRAVAIDSAAVTRVHIPMRELRPCAPRSQLRCCLGRGCSRDRL